MLGVAGSSGRGSLGRVGAQLVDISRAKSDRIDTGPALSLQNWLEEPMGNFEILSPNRSFLGPLGPPRGLSKAVGWDRPGRTGNWMEKACWRSLGPRKCHFVELIASIRIGTRSLGITHRDGSNGGGYYEREQSIAGRRSYLWPIFADLRQIRPGLGRDWWVG